METSHRRTERFYLKLLLGIFIGIVLLIVICWSGHGLYVRWQERRLVRRAVVAIQHGDDATASLAARSVLQIKPTSAPAARVMAELAEKIGNRAALDWRHKVVEAEPQSVEDALAWARCALQFNEIGIAEKAMAGISEQGKQKAGYHAVAGLLAQARREDGKATTEWEKAVELDPNEKAYQLQLALQQLRNTNEDQKTAARTTLTNLRADPAQRTAATRALLADAIARRENAQRLLDLAREVKDYPEATTNDRIIYLDLLHQAQDPQFITYLTELENQVAAQPIDLAALLEWMSQNNLNLFALDFVKTLSADQLNKWPVPVAVADIYLRLREWKKLEEVTKNSNWQQGDFLRHAYLARALRGQDKAAASEHEWAAATKAAADRSDSVMTLVRATDEWRWDKEMLELLWSLTSDPEKQSTAIQTLYRYYSSRDDSQGLYRVLVRWVELAPNDLNLQNNLAQVSLLLEANVVDARRMAADLYHKAPSNPAFATTYAYSLLTNGNPKEAARIMNMLSPEQLRDPAVSAYYGICLAAMHDEKARDYLATGQQAPLLPEEKKLIDKALANLNSWRQVQ